VVIQGNTGKRITDKTRKQERKREMQSNEGERRRKIK
jgi:hypothetical protein